MAGHAAALVANTVMFEKSMRAQSCVQRQLWSVAVSTDRWDTSYAPHNSLVSEFERER